MWGPEILLDLCCHTLPLYSAAWGRLGASCTALEEMIKMGTGTQVVGFGLGWYVFGPALAHHQESKQVPCSYCDRRNGCMMTQCPNYPQLYAATIARRGPASPSNPAPPSPPFWRRKGEPTSV